MLYSRTHAHTYSGLMVIVACIHHFNMLYIHANCVSFGMLCGMVGVRLMLGKFVYFAVTCILWQQNYTQNNCHFRICVCINILSVWRSYAAVSCHSRLSISVFRVGIFGWWWWKYSFSTQSQCMKCVFFGWFKFSLLAIIVCDYKLLLLLLLVAASWIPFHVIHLIALI